MKATRQIQLHGKSNCVYFVSYMFIICSKNLETSHTLTFQKNNIGLIHWNGDSINEVVIQLN